MDSTDDRLVLDYKLGESYVIGGKHGTKTRLILSEALFRQRQGKSFWMVVPDLRTLDYCVAHGIKPSNIKLPWEFLDESLRPDDWWQQAHVGIFDDVL